MCSSVAWSCSAAASAVEAHVGAPSSCSWCVAAPIAKRHASSEQRASASAAACEVSVTWSGFGFGLGFGLGLG